MPRLLSLNVGIPRDVSWNGKSVRTAVWKSPVLGRRMARKLNIDGDAQADLEGHGGEQRAVFVYQMDSYHHWEQFLGRNDFTFGQFGENFTVEGLLDDEVCIGDRYSIGDAVFEVTQPRVTCYRVGIRMNEPRMPALLVAHRRPAVPLPGRNDAALRGSWRMRIANPPPWGDSRAARPRGTGTPHTSTKPGMAVFLPGNARARVGFQKCAGECGTCQ